MSEGELVMNPDYDKEVKLQVACDLIGNLDELVATVWIDKAIKKLEELKFIRDNIPF